VGTPGFPCTRETNYFCIKVHDQSGTARTVRVLILDRLVHSYTSLEDPTRLVYGYEKGLRGGDTVPRERDVTCASSSSGGGYTFPKYMEATTRQRPGRDRD